MAQLQQAVSMLQA